MSTDQQYVGDLVKAEAVSIEENPVLREDVAKAVSEIGVDWDTIRKQNKNVFAQNSEITIFRKPRSGCKHCHGRGFIGFYSKDSKRMPLEPTLCSCLTNTLSIRGEMPDPSDRMSDTEFRDMLAKARQVYNLKEPQNEQDGQVDANTIQDDVQENA